MATGSTTYQDRKLTYKSVAFSDTNNEFAMKEIGRVENLIHIT